ncbi:MAG: SRPBCC domain-containing protein [Alphaproteobacteria bacterium]
MIDPLVRTIEVPCNQAKAFNVFLGEMHAWWPLDKFSVSALTGKTAKTLRVDARAGGRIVEISQDDEEHPWGEIRAYDPHDYVAMDFHIPHPSDREGEFSLVELRFIVMGEDRTRVELVQTNWEAFGKKAEMLRGGYGGGWTLIFEQAYKAACGG